MDFAPIFAGFVLRAHAAPFFPSRLSASAKLFHPRCQLAAEPVITDRVMKEAEVSDGRLHLFFRILLILRILLIFLIMPV